MYLIDYYRQSADGSVHERRVAVGAETLEEATKLLKSDDENFLAIRHEYYATGTVAVISDSVASHEASHPESSQSATALTIEDARFLEVSAGVRYWEDAKLNGEEDTDGRIPLRNGDLWTPVIELATGYILDWPEGVKADIHYKVCDAGEYWLLDESKSRLAAWKGYYVPNSILCVGDNGYGDYIIFKVEGNGQIANWKEPTLDADQWNLL